MDGRLSGDAGAGPTARATSFGAVAQHYARFRPPPPLEAVEWVLGGEQGSAVDIGAGTGAVTRQLVALVRHVTAVEPDVRMGAVLRQQAPRASVVSGRAEAMPLREGSVDAVVGSSMWHWVDEERAAFEVARVLRPGGVLGLLWSGPDRSEGWLADVLAGSAIGQAADWAADSGQSTERRHRHEVHLPEDAPFGEPAAFELQWSMPVTPEDLVGLAGTYSRFIVLPEDEQAALRERARDLVDHHPALAGLGEIEMPMRCKCWRAVRLA